jgi:trigger factor
MGGTEALRQQAINDALPDLYARAVVDTEVDPIAPPEIDITSGGTEGPVVFDAVVEVRPTVSIPGYGGLLVTLPSPIAAEEEIDAQIDRMRKTQAELSVVTRPAVETDHVILDVSGSGPGASDVDVEDFDYEVGAGSDIPGLDDHLRGAKAGDKFDLDLPTSGDDSEEVTSFAVTVKEVKEQILPDITDEWASEASEFDTVEDLRTDLRKRLSQYKTVQANMMLRDRAVDALVELVEDDAPDPMVEAEVRERIHDLTHRLQSRKVSVEQFLAASGRDEQSLLDEFKVQAVRAVKLDLALRALADSEDLDLTDEELDQAIAEMAEQAETTTEDLKERLERAGRLPAVRSERRKAKALTWLLDHVGIVDEAGVPIAKEDLEIKNDSTEQDEQQGGEESSSDDEAQEPDE